MAIAEQYPPASWKAQGKAALYFPVEHISETRENRIVERERPYRDGAKIDDTGSKARRWTLKVLFENSQDEPGVKNGGTPLYPDILNKLAESFDVHETGDLVVPTIGKVRARAARFEREESVEPRDAAMVTLTFVEDNEDATTAAKISPPTVHSSARKLAGQTTFTAQAAGGWNGSLSQLNDFMNELEGIANAPDTFLGELEDRARICRHLSERAVKLMSDNSSEAGKLLLDPANSSLVRKLLHLADTVAGAEGDSESAPTRPKTKSFTVIGNRSLASIANQLGQNYDDLLKINTARIEDPSFIEDGSVIRVFAA